MIEVRFEKRAGVSSRWVEGVVAHTLKSEKVDLGCDCHGLELNVLVTDDRRIRRINKKFLKHDYATDVISFGSNASADLLQGDLVVSADTARRVAKEMKIPFRQELARYLVHGTLHLLGYDDKKKKDHVKMHDRQEKILKDCL